MQFPTYTVTSVNPTGIVSPSGTEFDDVEASAADFGTPTLSQGSGKWEFYVARPHGFVVGGTFTPSIQ